MIEILPNEELWRGSYEVPSVVDEKVYLYIYNEIFVNEWNKYIVKKKADANFLNSEWMIERSMSENNKLFDSLFYLEELKAAEKVRKFIDFRRIKKGKQLQILVENFDSRRNFLIPYNGKFYTYMIQNSYAYFISIYMLEDHEIVETINTLYLKLSKQKRIILRDDLLIGLNKLMNQKNLNIMSI